jgi:hypothetical protein
MDKETKELFERIEKCDPSQLNGYIQMFDRMLLYTVAVHTMPREALQAAQQMWLKAARKGIDKEATGRTNFLEGTREGRFQKMMRQPDGEDVRVKHLEILQLAKDIINRNFEKGTFDGPGFDTPDLDDDE